MPELVNSKGFFFFFCMVDDTPSGVDWIFDK